MHAPWPRLVGGVEPQVVAVHRAISAATLSAARLSLGEALSHEGSLVHDILHYRAAASAAANLAQLGVDALTAQVQNSGHLPARTAFAHPRGVQGKVSSTAPALEVPRALALTPNWRGLFAPGGNPSRSLNRTRMDLPGGRPANLVCR